MNCGAQEEMRSALTPGFSIKGSGWRTIKWPVGGGLGTEPQLWVSQMAEKRRSDATGKTRGDDESNDQNNPVCCQVSWGRDQLLSRFFLQMLNAYRHTHVEEEVRKDWPVCTLTCRLMDWHPGVLFHCCTVRSKNFPGKDFKGKTHLPLPVPESCSMC